MAFRVLALLGLVCATVSAGIIREKRGYGYQGSGGYVQPGNPNFNVDRDYSTGNGQGRYHHHHYETPNSYQDGYYHTYSSGSSYPNQGGFYPGQNQGGFYPGQSQGGFYPGQGQGGFYPGQSQGNFGGVRSGFNQGPMNPGFGQPTTGQIPVVPSHSAGETPQFDAGARSSSGSDSSVGEPPVDSGASGLDVPAADPVPETTTDSSLLLPSTSTVDPNSAQLVPNPPVLG
uniref:Secreted protein n=1 Tax=Steinernema glaseri TaxID=37863 RepID=A0A1I8AKV1_9BILA